MIPFKTIEIARTTWTCSECGWKPASVEGSARYDELVGHVAASHNMGAPTLMKKTIFVTGHGEQTCEVAVFTNL
jgi:hypothetical protein